MDKPIIFYGAGNDARNSKSIFKKYDPVCFVDRDPDKYSESFMGKRVVPLEQALNEFPDAMFYITSSKYKYEISFDLLAHVESERIINCEPGLVRRLSCRLLEDSIGWEIGREQFGLSFCCGVAGHSQYPRIAVPQDIYYETADEYDKLAEFVRNEREKLILSLGEDGHVCEGCPNLTYGIFPKQPGYISQFNNNMKAACNCRCFYCNNPAEYLSAYSKEMLEKAGKFDFVELAEGLKRYGLTCEETVYGWASGELTISRQKNKVFDYAKEHTFHILSNGLIYDDLMAEWMTDTSRGGILNISLDSGTRETFKRIKGVGAYDQVCENLVKYGRNRAKDIELKFIFCEGYNDNERDVDGFIEITKRANASWVTRDRNYDDLNKPLSENTIKSAQRFYNHARNADIPVFFRPAFSEKQAALIKNGEIILKESLDFSHCVVHPDHMPLIGRKRLNSLCTDVRNSQLELMSFEINEKGIEGSVAELGVHIGDFAKLLNIVFPKRKLYLFDTFEGFDDRDIEIETAKNFSSAANNKDFYAVSSIDIVLSKMQNPELCIIKKGWFPQTAEGIEDIFCFVHLDADLFAPIYAGLCFFYPRLTHGGYIMIHDYNDKHYLGAKTAVRQFCTENNISYTPLCDFAGYAVITK